MGVGVGGGQTELTGEERRAGAVRSQGRRLGKERVVTLVHRTALSADSAEATGQSCRQPSPCGHVRVWWCQLPRRCRRRPGQGGFLGNGEERKLFTVLPAPRPRAVRRSSGTTPDLQAEGGQTVRVSRGSHLFSF